MTSLTTFRVIAEIENVIRHRNEKPN